MGTFNEKALDGGGLQYLWGCLKAILADKADKTSIPTKFSQLQNDAFNNVDNVKQYSEINPPPYPVNSVNGKTGAVVIDIPSSAADIGLGNVDNVKQYSVSNPPPYPVTSVNGQTGAVTIDIPVPEDEIFIARYGETTNAEIETAYEAGKTPILFYNGASFSMFTRYNATTHIFGRIDEYGLTECGCVDNEWMDQVVTFAKSSDVKTYKLTKNGKEIKLDASSGTDYTIKENFGLTLHSMNNDSVTTLKITGLYDFEGLQNCSALLSSKSGEIVLFTIGSGDNGTVAKAVRMSDGAKRIKSIKYSSADKAIYVEMDTWCNNLGVQPLTTSAGLYDPVIAVVDAPDTAVAVDVIPVALQNDIPSITSSTSDLTAGTSALEDGQIYLVYE